MSIESKYVKANKALLAVSDLDGSLLNAEGQLSPYTVSVVKKFVKQGNLFCLATARPLRGMIDIYKKLGLKTIIINYNGADIINPTDKYFKGISYTFSNAIAKQILNDEQILKYSVNIITENEETSYIWKKPKSRSANQLIENWFHINNDEFVVYGNLIKEIPFDPHSINLVCKTKDLYTLNNRIITLCETLSLRTYGISSDLSCMEICTPMANKGNALKYLSCYYGIDLSHTLAFGDNDNDIEMLNLARFSFAMLNGNASAKLASKFVTPTTNSRNGVAKTLLRFLKAK